MAELSGAASREQLATLKDEWKLFLQEGHEIALESVPIREGLWHGN